MNLYETFCLTYGDGVSDVNITELIKFHQDQGTLATLTAVQPPGRFGAIALHEEQTKIENCRAKPLKINKKFIRIKSSLI